MRRSGKSFGSRSPTTKRSSIRWKSCYRRPATRGGRCLADRGRVRGGVEDADEQGRRRRASTTWRQYYLERIRSKAEKPKLRPALDLTIWTIVVFLLLLFVLGRFAWKPMLQGLQKRETRHPGRDRGRPDGAGGGATAARGGAGRARQDRGHAPRHHPEGPGRRPAHGRRDHGQGQGRHAGRARPARRDLETAHDQALQEIWRQTADLAALVSSKAIRRS